MDFLNKIIASVKNFKLERAHWLTIEFFRTIPFLLLAILMFYPDWTTLNVVKYVFGFLFVIALVTHTIRKALFPYVDLRKYAERSLDTPAGASVVFLGFCFIICTIMFVAADFFK